MNILRMINTIQNYAWGSRTFISELLGNPEVSQIPQAELWMGAHPKSSSLIQNGDTQVNLSYIIAEDPCNFLGSKNARLYNDQLPYLLKLLAADAPLSIQAHPNQKQARDGFARENKIGIPLDAFDRNYKDANHKPELICALTPFAAMCGFRIYSELTIYLRKFLPDYDSVKLAEFLIQPSPQSLKDFFMDLLELGKEDRRKLLSQYMNNIAQNINGNEQEQLIRQWSIELYRIFPDDIGILSPMLMNIIVLQPFEALYLEAGVLHSYLKGAGVEIMANSDNVLRGGLTPKRIDTEELVNILDFLPKPIYPIKPHINTDSETVYETPASEFKLSIIHHDTDKQTHVHYANSPEILFCYNGSFVIENCSQFLSLEKGHSVFIPYEVDGYTVQGTGILFRARCNL